MICNVSNCCTTICAFNYFTRFDPIKKGVLYTITCQIAYMTPPFGYNLFLMRAMAPKEITLQDIYRSILPFVIIMVIGLAIVMAFPEI